MVLKLHFIVMMGLLASILSVSCSLQGDSPVSIETVDMRINHFRQTAMGEGRYLVYLTQEDSDVGSSDWSYLYDKIEGFDYEKGYIYDLKVRKINIENPPADGSTIKYVLVNVRSKERALEDESFDIYLKSFGENFLTQSNEDLLLLYEYKIDCGNMCETLETGLESEENVTGTFIHGPDESLLLQSISYQPRN